MKKHFKGFVAKVDLLKSKHANEDKNGLMPVILLGIAGEMPSKNVLSGTIAENMDLSIGGVYLFNAKEQDYDPEYGRNFTFMRLSYALGAIELLQASDFVGNLKIVDVDSTESVSIEELDEALSSK